MKHECHEYLYCLYSGIIPVFIVITLRKRAQFLNGKNRSAIAGYGVPLAFFFVLTYMFFCRSIDSEQLLVVLRMRHSKELQLINEPAWMIALFPGPVVQQM